MEFLPVDEAMNKDIEQRALEGLERYAKQEHWQVVRYDHEKRDWLAAVEWTLTELVPKVREEALEEAAKLAAGAELRIGNGPNLNAYGEFIADAIRALKTKLRAKRHD